MRDPRLAAYACGDSAIEFALGLTTWSRDVILFTNADETQLSPDDLAPLERNGIRAGEERILRLEADAAGSLAQVVLQSGSAIPRDAIFVHAGRSQRSEFPEKLGVVLGSDGTAETDTCERSNVPGVWVVGDASRDVQFAIVAAAEGAKAAFAINRELREESCR